MLNIITIFIKIAIILTLILLTLLIIWKLSYNLNYWIRKSMANRLKNSWLNIMIIRMVSEANLNKIFIRNYTTIVDYSKFIFLVFLELNLIFFNLDLINVIEIKKERWYHYRVSILHSSLLLKEIKNLI